jgi:5'-3' exonuclease
MGVDGLLKALADVQRPVHIAEYRGLRVALDGHCFLHKGKYSACSDLIAGRLTERYLQPLLETVCALRDAGAQPLVVFDGGELPAKLATEEARRRMREDAKWKSSVLLRAGSNLSQAVEITAEMVALAMHKLRSFDVECIVAPYEADAELAHLSLSGYVDVCISLDGDLLAYGCRRVMFGIDGRQCGREVQLHDIENSRGLLPYRLTPDSLPDLCVLSGCDYLQNIPRIGLKTAAQLLHRSGGNLKRALRLARVRGFAVPPDYEERAKLARLVFLSQTIYDLQKHCLVPLRPLPPGMDDINRDYLGPMLPNQIAQLIARGDVHPITHVTFGPELFQASSATPSRESLEAHDKCQPPPQQQCVNDVQHHRSCQRPVHATFIHRQGHALTSTGSILQALDTNCINPSISSNTSLSSHCILLPGATRSEVLASTELHKSTQAVVVVKPDDFVSAQCMPAPIISRDDVLGKCARTIIDVAPDENHSASCDVAQQQSVSGAMLMPVADEQNRPRLPISPARMNDFRPPRPLVQNDQIPSQGIGQNTRTDAGILQPCASDFMDSCSSNTKRRRLGCRLAFNWHSVIDVA